MIILFKRIVAQKYLSLETVKYFTVTAGGEVSYEFYFHRQYITHRRQPVASLQKRRPCFDL
jgi:hypothetical protein